MSWADRLAPARMSRLALVGPAASFRGVLVATAGAGVVELEELEPSGGPAAEAVRRLGPGVEAAVTPRLSPAPVDPAELVRNGRADLLAGEAELERRAAAAVTRDGVTAAAGWAPATALAELAERLAPLGGAAVPLRTSRRGDPPTLLSPRGWGAAFRPLVDLYAAVPYRDIDPSVLAGLSYVLMFGMMFGDVGHGAVLLALGLAVRWSRHPLVVRIRGAWPFVAGAGLAACGFGFAYGEAFGPTGVVPALWLAPLDRPTALLAAAVAVGAVLLGCAYAVGTVNRVRESGLGPALVAGSGLAGSALYAGLALVGAGWYVHSGAVVVAGVVVLVAGVALVMTGFAAESAGARGGVVQIGVETFDAVVRLGANAVSFARLAAFGMTHAALGGIVWSASVALWRRGAAGAAPAAVVFVVGNAVAFALEALVAAVQAMRLEYYELFSRVFVGQGRPFRPWHVRTASPEEVACPGS